MINWNDILTDIVAIIEPEHVPLEYIIMAKFTDKDGIENIVKGIELKKFLEEPDRTSVHEARIIVDVSKMKKTMAIEIVRFFENLSAKTVE